MIACQQPQARGGFFRCAGSIIVLLLAAPMGAAQERAALLTQGADVITTPGVGRVLFAFLLAAGLAVGIAIALRRLLPKLRGPLASSAGLQVVERVNLGAGLRVHVLQVEEQRILLAENRGGLALIALPKSREQA